MTYGNDSPKITALHGLNLLFFFFTNASIRFAQPSIFAKGKMDTHFVARQT
jgi:hypothetical protein